MEEVDATDVTLAAVEAHYEDIEGDEPLAPLHVDANKKGHKVKLVPDSWASVNVISNDLVKEFKLDLEECEEARVVRFADGKEQKCNTNNRCEMTITNGRESQERFLVRPLASENSIILGIP